MERAGVTVQGLGHERDQLFADVWLSFFLYLVGLWLFFGHFGLRRLVCQNVVVLASVGVSLTHTASISAYHLVQSGPLQTSTLFILVHLPQPIQPLAASSLLQLALRIPCAFNWLVYLDLSHLIRGFVVAHFLAGLF